MIKDSNPGCLDLSTGGLFSPEESHMLNAERELHEELGLDIRDTACTFRFVACRPYSDQWVSHFAYLFALNVYNDEKIVK